VDRRLPSLLFGREHGAPVQLEFEGDAVKACEGESVAVALFASDQRVLSRSVKYHRPRGFFCLDGSCGSCLMRIDGLPNVKACRTLVRDGMKVERQNAFPSGTFDVLGAADFFFPKGMDHHTMMTSPRALNAVMQKIVRQLAGLGKLPDETEGELKLPRSQSRHVEFLVVGAGPAGLAAATAAASRGRKVLLIDEQERAGGSYLSHPAFGIAAADRAVEKAQRAGVELLLQAAAFGWYPEDRANDRVGLLAVTTPEGLLKLTADRYVYATGAYDQNALFVDNDRPGVMSARAVGRLLVRFGIRPAERPVVVGDGPYARALAEALEKAGAQVTRVDGIETKVVAAHGHSWVKALEVTGGKKIKCDLVAVAALPAPASELPRQHGVPVEFRDGGFACAQKSTASTLRAERDGAPAGAGDVRVFCCGDVTGFLGPEKAAEMGTAFE
jgi:sarcosine oxidase subunit alpha